MRSDDPPENRAADRRQLASWLALVGVGLLALYLCWLMLQPFLDVLLWAVVLVIVFRPMHRLVLNRTGRPALSAVISCLLVGLILLLPLGAVLLAVLDELSDLPQLLQRVLGPLRETPSPEVQRVLDWAHQYVDFEPLRTPRFYIAKAQELAGTLSQWTLGLVSNVLEAALKMFFVFVSMYYLFRDGDRILAELRARLPLAAEQTEKILRRTREVIDASVYGVLVIAVVQGVLGGVAFGVLGLPSAVLWALLLTVFSTIPLAGSFLVWVPACLWFLADGSWGKAIVLATWCGIVGGGIDNVLRPLLVGRRAGLHELFIFFSVLGGLRVFGILGMVLGPVVLALTLALLEIIFQDHEAREDEPTQRAEVTGAAGGGAAQIPPE